MLWEAFKAPREDGAKLSRQLNSINSTGAHYLLRLLTHILGDFPQLSDGYATRLGPPLTKMDSDTINDRKSSIFDLEGSSVAPMTAKFRGRKKTSSGGARGWLDRVKVDPVTILARSDSDTMASRFPKHSVPETGV